MKTITLPDTGNTNPVEIIDVLVKVGDNLSKGQTLITLESDKATIDVPAPTEGVVKSLKVKVGDKIKTGDVILELSQENSEIKSDSTPAVKETPKSEMNKATVEASATTTPASTRAMVEEPDTVSDIYAGPGARRLARVLDIDLKGWRGTGEKGRITQEDVEGYVKQRLANGGSGSTLLPQMPVIDFGAFGEIETTPLSRIKKLTAQNLSRNWLLAPHVTQFDSADITEMEDFRKKMAPRFEKEGVKLTPLVFIMKAVTHALAEFPQFNASLDASGENLITKKYFHLGIAVDTNEGLVVPVIRDVDKKSLGQLAKELAAVSQKARDKKLTTQDMQGSSFTISSLGGIGGTAFTPIINLPNVAILGISKARIAPVYDGNQFLPRLMLPLSLSYDHRVIDGAEAARFCVRISGHLNDIRELLL